MLLGLSLNLNNSANFQGISLFTGSVWNNIKVYKPTKYCSVLWIIWDIVTMRIFPQVKPNILYLVIILCNVMLLLAAGIRLTNKFYRCSVEKLWIGVLFVLSVCKGITTVACFSFCTRQTVQFIYYTVIWLHILYI